MKYYYGFFRDNNTTNDPDGQLYKVVIRVNDGDASKRVQEELLLADSPFVVEYASEDDVFAPYKCSTATVRLMNREFNPDFNSVDVQDVEVLLLKLKETEVYIDDLGNSAYDESKFIVEWCGYVTPNSYAQGYNSYYDEYELECQDRLSVLKFADAVVPSVAKEGFYTLLQSVSALIDQCDLHKLCISDNIRVPDFDYNIGTTEEILANLEGNSYLFGNVLIDDITKDNGEETRKAIEVLEDICTVLNLTAVQIGDALYLLSYDAIANGYNTYSYCDFKTYEFRKVNLRNVVELVKEESAANDMNISLATVYGRFKVVANQIKTSREFPDLTDWASRQARSSKEGAYSYPQSRGCYTRGMYYGHPIGYPYYEEEDDTEAKVVIRDMTPEDGGNELRCVLNFDFFGINPNVYEDKRVIEVVGKCFSNAGREKSGYGFGNLVLIDPNNTYASPSNTNICARDMIVATGCYYNRWEGNDNDVAREGYGATTGSSHYGYAIFHDDFEFAGLMTGDITAQNEYKTRATNPEWNMSFDLLEFKMKDVVVSQSDYIVVNADFTYFIDMLIHFGEWNVYASKDMSFQWMKFQFVCGGKTYWWNSRLGKWEYDMDMEYARDKMTKVWLDTTPYETDKDKATLSYDNTISVRNTVLPKYRLGKDVKGFVLPSPTSSVSCDNKEAVVKGTLSVIISRPWGVNNTAKTACTFVENPSILIASPEEFVNKTGTFSVDRDDDTEYSVNTSVRSDDKETDVNLVSYNGKGHSDNCLYQLDTYGKNVRFVKYLDYVQNLTSGDTMRPEEMVVSAYRRQYNSPTLVLNATVHSDVDMKSKITYRRFKNKKFVVNGISVDYRYNRKTVSLIEKK